MSEPDFQQRVLDVSGDNTPTGKGETEVYKPIVTTNPEFYNSSTVDLTSASGVFAFPQIDPGSGAINTVVLTDADLGSILVVKGVRYTITTRTSAIAGTVTPKPTANHSSAAGEWYL